jgi:hypothetical protein
MSNINQLAKKKLKLSCSWSLQGKRTELQRYLYFNACSIEEAKTFADPKLYNQKTPRSGVNTLVWKCSTARDIKIHERIAKIKFRKDNKQNKLNLG